MTKYCPNCDATKATDEFYSDRHRKDGLSSNCKECKRKRQTNLRPTPEGLASPTKPCSSCQRELPRDAFSPHKTGFYGLQAYCKECQALKSADEHRVRNADLFAYVKTLKEQSGCMDCPPDRRIHPAHRLDFDHVRGVKLGNISTMVRRFGTTRAMLDAEIAKCEVVCANCHRDRTHARYLESLADRKAALECLEESPATSG